MEALEKPQLSLRGPCIESSHDQLQRYLVTLTSHELIDASERLHNDVRNAEEVAQNLISDMYSGLMAVGQVVQERRSESAETERYVHHLTESCGHFLDTLTPLVTQRLQPLAANQTRLERLGKTLKAIMGAFLTPQAMQSCLQRDAPEEAMKLYMRAKPLLDALVKRPPFDEIEKTAASILKIAKNRVRNALYAYAYSVGFDQTESESLLDGLARADRLTSLGVKEDGVQNEGFGEETGVAPERLITPTRATRLLLQLGEGQSSVHSLFIAWSRCHVRALEKIHLPKLFGQTKELSRESQPQPPPSDALWHLSLQVVDTVILPHIVAQIDTELQTLRAAAAPCLIDSEVVTAVHQETVIGSLAALFRALLKTLTQEIAVRESGCVSIVRAASLFRTTLEPLQAIAVDTAPLLQQFLERLVMGLIKKEFVEGFRSFLATHFVSLLSASQKAFASLCSTETEEKPHFFNALARAAHAWNVGLATMLTDCQPLIAVLFEASDAPHSAYQRLTFYVETLVEESFGWLHRAGQKVLFQEGNTTDLNGNVGYCHSQSRPPMEDTRRKTRSEELPSVVGPSFEEALNITLQSCCDGHPAICPVFGVVLSVFFFWQAGEGLGNLRNIAETLFETTTQEPTPTSAATPARQHVPFLLRHRGRKIWFQGLSEAGRRNGEHFLAEACDTWGRSLGQRFRFFSGSHSEVESILHDARASFRFLYQCLGAPSFGPAERQEKTIVLASRSEAEEEVAGGRAFWNPSQPLDPGRHILAVEQAFRRNTETPLASDVALNVSRVLHDHEAEDGQRHFAEDAPPLTFAAQASGLLSCVLVREVLERLRYYLNELDTEVLSADAVHGLQLDLILLRDGLQQAARASAFSALESAIESSYCKALNNNSTDSSLQDTLHLNSTPTTTAAKPFLRFACLQIQLLLEQRFSGVDHVLEEAFITLLEAALCSGANKTNAELPAFLLGRGELHKRLTKKLQPPPGGTRARGLEYQAYSGMLSAFDERKETTSGH